MSYHIIWHTESDLASRIKEIREMRELLLEREGELVLLFDAIQGHMNCVIDSNGKLIQLGPKTEQTDYEKSKPRRDVLKKYRDNMIVPKSRWQHKPVWEN